MKKQIIIQNPRLVRINGLEYVPEFLFDQVLRMIEKELLKRSIFCDITVREKYT